MSDNDYYKRTKEFDPRTRANGLDVEFELDAISAAFDKIPAPREDGQGYDGPIHVGAATAPTHAVQLQQMEAKLGDNTENANRAEEAAERAEEARDIAIEKARQSGEARDEALEAAATVTNIHREQLEKALGVNARVYPRLTNQNLKVGDVIPAPEDTADGLPITHVIVDGNAYAMSPLASGFVSNLSDTGATIGGVMVSLEKNTTLKGGLSNDRTSQLIAGVYQSSGFELVTDQALAGQGRLSTIIESPSGAVISRSQTEETNDTILSRVTLKGGGKGVAGTVGYDLRSPSGVQKSAIRNRLDNVAIRDCEVGIASNSGWNNILTAYRVTDCGTGYKSSTSWISGWGGSGNVSIGGYYAACNTGIDTTSQWNMCFINTVVEYCQTPIYERGNSNTYINTWLEGNSNPVKVIRGSVFINGRGLSFDLSEITADEPKETLTLITNRGAKFARRDLAKPEFNVDGEGVTDIRTPVSGAAWQHFRTAFSGSGERSSIEQTTYTGTTTAQARTESVPISSVKQLVTADSSNNMFGAVAFFAGKAASDGTPDVTHPFAEKWRVRFDGELRPAVDGLYDIASPSRRVDQIFLVNQPSVTSSRTYKTNEREIPEAVLRAVRKVPFKLFEYTDSIERKGGTYGQIGKSGARTHVNPIIEDIIAAFESEGVDPWQFAVIRKVSWDSEPANYDDEGKLISEAMDAGERLELVEAQWLALKMASICNDF
ncbi:TPA: hypothetical protein ACGG7T_001680 [Vibrio cholerae]